MAAAMLVAKYAGIIVLSDDMTGPRRVFPLLLERLNIYTDPQRPMTQNEGIYEIGGPWSPDSVHLLITTNFSLTYFIVSRRNRVFPGARLVAYQGHRGALAS